MLHSIALLSHPLLIPISPPPFLILPPLFPLPHLRLRQHQTGGHLEPLRSRQVLVLPEVFLQFEELLRREGGARASRLPQEAVLAHTCNEEGQGLSQVRLIVQTWGEKFRHGVGSYKEDGIQAVVLSMYRCLWEV